VDGVRGPGAAHLRGHRGRRASPRSVTGNGLPGPERPGHAQRTGPAA
jgi:hypothetical protein